MAGVLNISEAAVLGLHATALLAGSGDDHLSTREMAGALGASEAHLAKVMQRLARAHLVHSVRGPGGGFKLSRAAAEVSLLDVYQAIEGPLDESTCLMAIPACGGDKCVLGDLLRRISAQVRTYLEQTRLSDLAFVKELLAGRAVTGVKIA